MRKWWRSDDKKKSSSGQAPILAAVLFLLLVPTTIIIAENATINLTGNMVVNITFNATNETADPSEEFLLNPTSMMNTSADQPPEPPTTDNTTDTITILNDSHFSGPLIGVSLDVPERALRNEPFVVSAEISNTGDSDAGNVEIEWIIPEGIDILEGNRTSTLKIPANDSFPISLKLKSPLDSEIGYKNIRIVISHD